MKIVRRALVTGAALIATTLASGAPLAAQADTGPIDRARMTQYARAHVALNDARDEFHGKVGRLHDEQGRERARQELESLVAEILEANEMTREEYDQLTLLISMDGDARTLFEEVMAELAEERVPRS